MKKIDTCGDCYFFDKIQKRHNFGKDVGECTEPHKDGGYLVNKHNRNICGSFINFQDDVDNENEIFG